MSQVCAATKGSVERVVERKALAAQDCRRLRKSACPLVDTLAPSSWKPPFKTVKSSRMLGWFRPNGVYRAAFILD